VKGLQPGEALAAPEGERHFLYDCYTRDGSAGSYIVDVTSSRVLGLHLGWRHLPEQQARANIAVALWSSPDDPLLLAAEVWFS
jgi:hypothetical protein